MRVEIGDHDDVYGVVETHPDGRVTYEAAAAAAAAADRAHDGGDHVSGDHVSGDHDGGDVELLRTIVANMRRPGQTEAQTVESLPQRLVSLLWAREVTP